LRNHEDHFYYLMFHTIHDVLKAEKVLKEHGFRFELVPVPRNLSSDCGSCIKLAEGFEEAMQQITGIVMGKCFLFNGGVFQEIPLPDGN
jgi:hypothetical protein